MALLFPLHSARSGLAILPAFLLCLALPTHTKADVALSQSVSAYADLRFRLESDWNSHRDDGSLREDRDRARIRARVGVNWTPSEHWQAGARLRTGASDSQQSPHLTIIDFSGNDRGDQDVNFDKWFVQYTSGDSKVWAGRNTYPFWKRHDLLWTDDVTPAGIAGKTKLGSVLLTGGYFKLPAGMHHWTGEMGGVQAAQLGSDYTIALGYYDLKAADNDPDGDLLLQNNSEREYRLLQLDAQKQWEVFNYTLITGFDFTHNFASYHPSDTLAYSNRDERDGYVGYATVGSTRDPGGWLFGYYYAHIEQLAVNNSYSQDDWMRWGSSTQVRSSNFKGHELRVAHRFEKIEFVARFYHVQALNGNEDGSRLRLDWNWRL